MRVFGYWVAFLTFLNDLLFTSSAFWIAYFLRFHILLILFPLPSGHPAIANYLLLYTMVLVVWPLAFHLTRAYRPHFRPTGEDAFFHVLTRVALASLLVWSLALYYRVFIQRGAPSQEWLEPSRLMFLLFMALDVWAVLIGRVVTKEIVDKLRAKGWQIRRSLIIGTGVLAKSVVEETLRHPDFGIRLVGFVGDNGTTAYKDVRVLGPIEELPNLVHQHQIDTVFIALPFSEYPRLQHVLEQLTGRPLDICIVYDTVTYNYLRGTVNYLGNLFLIGVNDTPLNGPGFVAKRILDIVLGSIGLILSLPLLAIIALAIRLNSRGPILFRQIRMGLDGRPFVMYKFRTMVLDAEDGTGPAMAHPNDPRVTAVGRILRKFSLDELPQLWNVIKGDMSLVGPRPERPHFVEHFTRIYPQYQLRLRAKGGITGWAQIHGLRGSSDNMEKRIEFDFYYLTHWSLKLDLLILLLTPFRLFRYKGIT